MARQHLYTLVVAVVVSTAVGFAIATLSRPDTASAGAYAASSDATVVSQLKKLNRGVANVNHALGATYKQYSLIGETHNGFRDVEGAVGKMCRALAEASYDCPLP